MQLHRRTPKFLQYYINPINYDLFSTPNNSFPNSPTHSHKRCLLSTSITKRWSGLLCCLPFYLFLIVFCHNSNPTFVVKSCLLAKGRQKAIFNTASFLLTIGFFISNVVLIISSVPPTWVGLSSHIYGFRRPLPTIIMREEISQVYLQRYCLAVQEILDSHLTVMSTP